MRRRADKVAAAVLAGTGAVRAVAGELVKTKAALKALEAENERLRNLLAWAYDTLVEINVSNYDHDDVCRLNDASVEVILGIKDEVVPAAAQGEDDGRDS